jgi:Plasmid pRiA4b ORF-3-like protein
MFYQLKVVLAEISPMIWRRLLVHGDTTLADLHYILQIAFGWSDFHLHRFILYGKEYGIPRIGGYWFHDDANHIRFADLGLRQRERFLYEYDGFDQVFKSVG